MALQGTNFSLDTRDFTFSGDGLNILGGKERAIRNFVKFLKTETGVQTSGNVKNLQTIQDTDDRYNALVGLDTPRLLGKFNTRQEAVQTVKQEVERAVSRFITNQQTQIDFLDEDEVFVRYVVDAAPYYDIGVYFTIRLWTALDRRLGRNPSLTKSFVQAA